MTLLHWFSDSWVLFFTYAVIFGGIICYFLSKIVGINPLIEAWKLPIEVIGIIVICFGTYVYGGNKVEQNYRKQISEVKEKLRIAETQSQQINVVVEEKVVTKIKTIKDTVYINTETIKEVVAEQLDSQCNLTEMSIRLHNAAASNELLDLAQKVKP